MKKTQANIILGSKLRSYFKSQKITQQQLATILNTRQSWISRIYDGEFTIRSDIARTLSEMANIPFLDNQSDQMELRKERKVIQVAQQLVSLSEGDAETIAKIKRILGTLV